MENGTVIVLSSSPTLPEPSKTPSKPASKFSTPTKKHDNVWSIPASSSPLPSPREMLRGLLQPKATSAGLSAIGRGFRTAKEILQKERESEASALATVSLNEPTSFSTATANPVPLWGKTSAQIGNFEPSKVKHKARGKTVAKKENTVKRPGVASAHFAKKGKTVTGSHSSKSVSLVEGPHWKQNFVNKHKTFSEHVDTLSDVEQMGDAEQKAVVNATDDVLPPRKRVWTPVKNAVTVEMQSPMDTHLLRDTKLDEIALSTIGDEYLEGMNRTLFGDRVGIFKYSGNSMGSAIGPNFGQTTLTGMILPTNKRRIEVPGKPRSAFTAATGPEKKQPKKSRKKKQSITELATAGYRARESNKPEAAGSDTLLRASEDQPLPLKPQSVEKPKRQRKSKAATETKQPRKRQRATKAPVPVVEERIELPSPRSAIKRVNDQEVKFGTYSQLASEDPKPIDVEASEYQSVSHLDVPRFKGLAKVRTVGLGVSSELDEELEAWEKFLESESDIERKATERLLWEAAARDSNGNLMTLSQTPKTEAQQAIPQPVGITKNGKKGTSRSLDIDLASIHDSPVTGSPALSMDSFLDSPIHAFLEGGGVTKKPESTMEALSQESTDAEALRGIANATSRRKKSNEASPQEFSNAGSLPLTINATSRKKKLNAASTQESSDVESLPGIVRARSQKKKADDVSSQESSDVGSLPGVVKARSRKKKARDASSQEFSDVGSLPGIVGARIRKKKANEASSQESSDVESLSGVVKARSRGKKANEASFQKSSDVESLPGVVKARSRKKKANEASSQEFSDVGSLPGIVKARSRKKKANEASSQEFSDIGSLPGVVKARSRRKKATEASSQESSDVESLPGTVKARRKKKMNEASSQESSDVPLPLFIKAASRRRKSNAASSQESSGVESLPGIAKARQKSNNESDRTEGTSISGASALATRGKKKTKTKATAKKRAPSPLSPPAGKRRRRSTSPVYKVSEAGDERKYRRMHECITRAVIAEYKSEADVPKSWHYKILRYEPLIVEDFTIWLNTTGLGKIGVDDEVDPHIVKKWAEKRSVSVVWRETHRGKERSRF